jgi:hypothetical protein
MLKHLFPLFTEVKQHRDSQYLDGGLWVCVHPISKETAEQLLKIFKGLPPRA